MPSRQPHSLKLLWTISIWRHLWPCSSGNQDLGVHEAFLQTPCSWGLWHNLINCHQSLGGYGSLCSYRWGHKSGAESVRPQTGKGQVGHWAAGRKTGRESLSIFLTQFFLQAFKTAMFCPWRTIGNCSPAPMDPLIVWSRLWLKYHFCF